MVPPEPDVRAFDLEIHALPAAAALYAAQESEGLFILQRNCNWRTNLGSLLAEVYA